MQACNKTNRSNLVPKHIIEDTLMQVVMLVSPIAAPGTADGARHSHQKSQSSCVGASFFYSASTVPYEAQEVRAFGLFLQDMVQRLHADDAARGTPLQDIWRDCLSNPATVRPSFQGLCTRLAGIGLPA